MWQPAETFRYSNQDASASHDTRKRFPALSIRYGLLSTYGVSQLALAAVRIAASDAFLNTKIPAANPAFTELTAQAVAQGLTASRNRPPTKFEYLSTPPIVQEFEAVATPRLSAEERASIIHALDPQQSVRLSPHKLRLLSRLSSEQRTALLSAFAYRCRRELLKSINAVGGQIALLSERNPQDPQAHTAAVIKALLAEDPANTTNLLVHVSIVNLPPSRSGFLFTLSDPFIRTGFIGRGSKVVSWATLPADENAPAYLYELYDRYTSLDFPSPHECGLASIVQVLTTRYSEVIRHWNDSSPSAQQMAGIAEFKAEFLARIGAVREELRYDAYPMVHLAVKRTYIGTGILREEFFIHYPDSRLVRLSVITLIDLDSLSVRDRARGGKRVLTRKPVYFSSPMEIGKLTDTSDNSTSNSRLMTLKLLHSQGIKFR